MANYFVSLAIFTGTYALFALGLNLQWGYTGLINFGHIAFMTIGAYATILLSLSGVPLVAAVGIGALLAAILGLLIGFSTLRLREDYLAIVTIGVSEVVRLIALNEAWLTRGTRGVYGYPLPLATWEPNLLGRLLMIGLLTLVAGLAGWRLLRWTQQPYRALRHGRNPQALGRLGLGIASLILGLIIYGSGVMALYDYTYKAGLMLVLALTLGLVFWQLERWVRSPWGRVLKAIREDEEVPKALGKNVFWYKLQAFMLGGAIAGLAGAFYAWQLTYINPEGFIPLITFQAWIIVLLGGAGNNAGTLLGAIIFWAYTALTRFLLPQIMPFDDARQSAFRIMLIGLVLIVLMMWRPQGILGKKEELTLGR
jgi:neutral amino acid transport system permease protein